ncbi:hypothetical protein [Parasphingorhabdus sp.]|uniref:hypothetical protein n=1 Tax=Parasphingorhabdus sp. TaxID=2709688 RepID=UPI0035938796
MIIGIRHSPLRLWLIAAVALPLAATPLAASPAGMTVELCSADGAVRTLTIPVDRDNGEADCVTPCHACLNRKKPSKG